LVSSSIERTYLSFHDNTLKTVVFKLFSLILKMMRWAGHVARMEKRNYYRIVVGTPEEKRQLERPRHRRVGNIKMDLRAIGWDGMDWIDLTPDRDQ
jgi:hypothetical protein